MLGYDERHREQLPYDERIARGRRAADMLADDEFWAKVRDGFVAEWVDALDSAARDMIWAKVHAIEAIQKQLRVAVGDGQAAAVARDKANH